MSKEEKRVILTYSTTSDGETFLNNLQKEYGLSKLQAINASLSILYWMSEEIKNGRIIASLDEESEHYKELSLEELFNKKPNQ